MVATDAIGSVSADQMRELDRVALESGLLLLQMMENAGIRLSEVVRRILAEANENRAITVLAGGGNNGGGALAAARHLANRGAEITVVLDRSPADLSEAGRRQVHILEQSRISVSRDPPVEPGMVVDGLIGYGLRGNVHGRISALIDWTNASGAPVCSLDVPSGLDATTGVPGTPCVRADVTLTLALPKLGLLVPAAAEVTGTLLVADISIPAGVYGALGLARPDAFGASPVVEVAR